jgi:DNA-binding beta-propeller fold protein YncE
VTALALALLLAAPAAPALPLAAEAVQVLAAPAPAAALAEPTGVAVDALGRPWASDAAGHRVVRWDAEGRWLGEVGALGSDFNQFRRPVALARLGSLGVAVLDAENRRIVAFDQLMRRTDLVVSLDDPELERVTGRVTPVAIAADRGGSIVVADAERDRLLVFDFSGAFQRSVGGYGTAPGAFHGIEGVAVAPRGELVTLERAMPAPKRPRGAAGDPAAGAPARVQWLDTGGAPLLQWTLPPGGPARAVAVDDSGRVAVARESAPGDDEVTVFTRDGTPLARIGGLSGPRGLAFAPDGTLLVAEATAAHVRRFRLVRAHGD